MSDFAFLLHFDTNAEVDRLNFQHQVVLKLTSGALVPDGLLQKLTSLGRPPAAADVGAGTGNWLRDLAVQLPPDSRLDGYDYDSSKYPAESQLPASVNLMRADFFGPFPEEARGRYDLVHARFLVPSLKLHQWELVLSNLRTLLRPGGYLLWDDISFLTMTCLPMTEQFQKIINAAVRHSASEGVDATAPTRLVDQARDVGFTNCRELTFSSFKRDKDTQKLAGRMVLNALAKVLHSAVASGGFDWVQTSNDIKGPVDLISDDVDRGICVVGLQLHSLIAQNPGSGQ